MNIPLGKERLYIIKFDIWKTAVKLIKNNTSAPFSGSNDEKKEQQHVDGMRKREVLRG